MLKSYLAVKPSSPAAVNQYKPMCESVTKLRDRIPTPEVALVLVVPLERKGCVLNITHRCHSTLQLFLNYVAKKVLVGLLIG